MDDVSKVINARNKPVVIIGDSHIPYHHVDYLDFIKAVKAKFKNPIMLHSGDEVDNHSISFHPSDQDLFSAGHELDAAIEQLKPWVKAFPNLILLESNHGSLAFRKAKVNGTPLKYYKTLNEVYGAPKWKWYHDILLRTKIGDVYGCHGKASGYGALAKEQGCSSFQGHYHGKLEITWHQRVGHKRFNMFVGCGINWKSMAFHYGKNNLPKPILGCAALTKDGFPKLYKMTVDKHSRWNGKI